eukprot:966268-Pyramimonas_sp.AAC.1
MGDGPQQELPQPPPDAWAEAARAAGLPSPAAGAPGGGRLPSSRGTPNPGGKGGTANETLEQRLSRVIGTQFNSIQHDMQPVSYTHLRAHETGAYL